MVIQEISLNIIWCRYRQAQAIRNIAEELDPTFQRKDAAEAGQINGAFIHSNNKWFLP